MSADSAVTTISYPAHRIRSLVGQDSKNRVNPCLLSKFALVSTLDPDVETHRLLLKTLRLPRLERWLRAHEAYVRTSAFASVCTLCQGGAGVVSVAVTQRPTRVLTDVRALVVE